MKVLRLVWFLPAIILLAGVVAYPLVRTTVLSFTHDNLATAFAPQYAGIDNFRRLLFDSRLHATIVTRSVFAVASVAAEFMIGLLLAL